MHHATLFVGEQREADAGIDSVFKFLGVKTLGNPDIFVIDTDVFVVDDARALGERAVEKAFGEKKFFIIKAEKFTPEAQNALLKTFEDPVPNTHFLISAREENIFLPTLLSRMHVERVGGELDENNEVKKFLKKTLKQRIDFAKKFADEKDERGAGALSEFLDSLMLELRASGTKVETLKKISTLREYTRDSSAMPRVILEHLALVI
ncbi:MAG: hypothetical protein AAB660_02980 [Patescibacteria group bacterium]